MPLRLLLASSALPAWCQNILVAGRARSPAPRGHPRLLPHRRRELLMASRASSSPGGGASSPRAAALAPPAAEEWSSYDWRKWRSRDL
nr:unnamed protein product [Digitaria exilis]